MIKKFILPKKKKNPCIKKQTTRAFGLISRPREKEVGDKSVTGKRKEGEKND